jgi:hypothetical protein
MRLMLFFICSEGRGAWRGFQYLEPADCQIVDFNRSELGLADGEATDRQTSDRQGADGKGT